MKMPMGSNKGNQFVVESDDSRIAMVDVARGIAAARGIELVEDVRVELRRGALRAEADLVVYTGLLMGRSVAEVAGYLGTSASEVYALDRLAKSRLTGTGDDQGRYLRGLVDAVRRVAEREGRWVEPKAEAVRSAFVRSRQQQVAGGVVGMSEFGARLMEKRVQAGLSRPQAARDAGVSEYVLRALEDGGRAVGFVRFAAVCAWMGLDVTEGVRLLGADGVVQVGSGGGGSGKSVRSGW